MILRQPLVILDGQLFCGAIGADFQLELTEITSATVLYQESNETFSKTFLVDLVVLKALPDYIQSLNSRLVSAHCELVEQVGHFKRSLFPE